MKLKSLAVSNFRCYRAKTELAFDDFTTLVGRNDCGKSSLLDALETFFNDKASDKNDAAKGATQKRSPLHVCLILYQPSCCSMRLPTLN
ncbi:AAA family ATPase [Terracidiphilus sp.]|uniref:AAA family ATPase n=1 Tax=Terracidiphilus sp. TaxID=1964191 RepID=UPI003C73AB89